MTQPAPAFAAVDWGTTRFRAWLLDEAGEVIAERRSEEGLLSLSRDRFAEVLEGHLEAMGADSSLPVVICGMAGSRQGWIEAPYVPTPASLAEIFTSAVAVPGTRRDVRMVPGVAQRDPARPDVMRGEETQLAGVAGLHKGDDLIVCMPGTHSKWVELESGAIKRFSTWMTGELFSVLAGHSILRHSVGAEPARVAPGDAVFGAWLDDGLANPGDAASRLFRIRASTLLLDMRPAEASAALSGLLIGSEVASAKGMFGEQKKLVLVVSGPLGDLYSEALKRAGFSATLVDADTAARRGLAEAARRNFLDGTRRKEA
ncbi:2-dehydro-3-deoxygalactonokinase [Mesorhizobium sp. BAC0120]|uniref:2-dehydro-3-deoxygalactonokinase n=1 Tax=Mesorhizobium sp. BAC0120 TaxID=3090670 RepID=UPI00298BE419|nr:2-dehydro-3-deoxygalactonokinase [Mesorhizobium sp. BAC0120]MDW6024574.1 2-dehydro-3-deoxygalactonokinase [Mesorhizobium sp. BAC0120]